MGKEDALNVGSSENLPLKLSFIDTTLTLDTDVLSRNLGVERNELLRHLISMGSVLTFPIYNPGTKIVRRSQDGLAEEDVFPLLEAKVSAEPSEFALIKGRERFGRKITEEEVLLGFNVTLINDLAVKYRELASYFEADANRTFRGVLDFLVEMANQERNGEARIIVRTGREEGVLSLTRLPNR